MKPFRSLVMSACIVFIGCMKQTPADNPTTIGPELSIRCGFSTTKVSHLIDGQVFKSQWQKGDTITVVVNNEYRYYVADSDGESTTFSLSDEHMSGFSVQDGMNAYAITGKLVVHDGKYVLLEENMGRQVFSKSKLPMDYQTSSAKIKESEVTFAFSYPCAFFKMSLPKHVIMAAENQLVVDIAGDYPFLLSNNTDNWVNNTCLTTSIYNPTTMEGLDPNDNWSSESMLYPNLLMNIEYNRYLSFYLRDGSNFYIIDNSALLSFPQGSLDSFGDDEEVNFYVAFNPEYRLVSLNEDRYLIRLFSKSNRDEVLYEKCAPICHLQNNTIYDVNLTAKYQSVDFSKDGESSIIYQSSAGKGIDIVFMGEGYTDLDMGEGGVYERDMNEAMEELFSYEPLASYKNYFNVFSVKVVSPFYDAEGDDSPLNEVEDVRGYFEGVPGINKEIMRVIVLRRFAVDVLKSDDPESATTEPSYTLNYSDGSFIVRMNHRYDTQKILLHEFMHGIAKVGDEYEEMGKTIDEDGIQLLKQAHSIGFYCNLDTTDDPEEVMWSHLLKDNRFDCEGKGFYVNNPALAGKNEGLDIFEGGFLHEKGVYRPSYYSLMNNNDNGLWSEWVNAPTREALYKHIMQAACSDDWVYDYEEFVAFDESYRDLVKQTFWNTSVPSEVHTPQKYNHISPIFAGESPNKSRISSEDIKKIIKKKLN